jgi:pantoate--beta-alanine ligase
MTIQYSISQLKSVLQNAGTIGFVPTMGALHEGHLSLVKKAKSENDICVVSIFVNPIQFNNKEDLEKYPRNLEKDAQYLGTVLGKNDVIFAPSVEEMYPSEPTEKYDFASLESVMEGKFRPGHFNGVAIVVKRLFDIVEPTCAYFGEKDYQQLQIIKKMVEIEKLPLRIVSCPIVRERNGLAMSSRNVRLSPEDRKNAAKIYGVLAEVAKAVKVAELVDNIVKKLNAIPNAKTEYVEIVDSKTLQSVESFERGKNYRLCVAIYFGDIRLIDNIEIKIAQ